MNAFHNVMKEEFPEIKGLQSTLLQYKCPLSRENIENGRTILQIIHMSHAVCSHWAVLHLVNKDIYFYDSAYTHIADNTLQVIAHLVKSNEQSIDIKLMNISKQCGSVDCGLYAIATVTCLALATDPTTIVFRQNEMRSHLITILETQKILMFPIQKRRKPINSISKVVQCNLFCVCRLPNEDEDMACCDKCEEWYHYKCLGIEDVS